MSETARQGGDGGATAARWGLVAGPLCLAATLLLPAPPEMPQPAWITAGLALWMAVWWSTEAVPVPVTGLLPLLAMPMTGLAGIKTAAAAYAHPLIFLFLGGFLIALAIQKHELHRRIAYLVILRVGTRPQALVAGFLMASGVLSMWVSNTATAMMMMPIALSVVGAAAHGGGDNDGGDVARTHESVFTPALLLAVAYGASIGGMGTLIGTPPNALLAAFARDEFGISIGFAAWMAVGVPVALLLGLCAWVCLTRWAFPVHRLRATISRAAILEASALLGPLRTPERRVIAVFTLTAGLWLARPLFADLPGLSGLSDENIAILGGILLFLIPAGGAAASREKLLRWADTATLPFGTLILFGGGLSLAQGIEQSGLAAWIGGALEVFAGLPGLWLVAIVAAVVVFLTEMTSNTATTAAFLPVMGALAVVAGEPPLMLMVPAALAASGAFMLPVATPPNAIVYGSGRVEIAAMLRAGFRLNLMTIVVVTLAVPPLCRWLLGGIVSITP